MFKKDETFKSRDNCQDTWCIMTIAFYFSIKGKFIVSVYEHRANIIRKREVSTNKLLGIAGTGWMFDALDVGMLSFIIAALKAEWNLSTEQMGWIGSINSIGMAVGALFFGLMADRIGRKNVFIFTLLLFSVCSGLSAFTTSLTIFMVLRFLIGMGLGGELPVASTLVSESVPTESRGRIVVLLESFWAVGWLISAVISYFIIPKFGWQTAMLISAIPALYTIYLRLGLPDSPRYTSLKPKEKPTVFQSIAKLFSQDNARQTIVLWILWFCVVLDRKSVV